MDEPTQINMLEPSIGVYVPVIWLAPPSSLLSFVNVVDFATINDRAMPMVDQFVVEPPHDIIPDALGAKESAARVPFIVLEPFGLIYIMCEESLLNT